jgi:GGDEF domain-containing protein
VVPVDVPEDRLEPLDDDDASLTDDATGLFNEQFFRVSLDTRVSAARRHLRPVAVVLVQVSQGVREGAPEPVAPDLVAEGVRATLRDADTACRLDDGRFALILEDTPENGAVWTVERVRRALAVVRPGQTLWAGIACYPAHAFDAWELYDRAEKALEAAREWHQDRIEVATAD